MTQIEETIDEAPYRAFLYDHFGRFFRGPRDDAWRAAWGDAAKVAAAFSESDPDVKLPEAVEMEKAFATCFYGVGPETVPLAQSCWESDKRLHCGPACLKTHELYARYGLVNDAQDHLPDDHAGVVLAFAAELVRRGEEADEKALRSFLLYGIGSWWPAAETVLRARPEWPVLAPVLETFGAFLRSECERLKAFAPTRTDTNP